MSPTSTTAYALSATGLGGVASQSLVVTVAAIAGRWLHTSGNHIYKADNTIWMGRGANLRDTRSCGHFAGDQASKIAEVKHRIDVLVDDWHANFIRLAFETRPDLGVGGNPTHFGTLLRDEIRKFE